MQGYQISFLTSPDKRHADKPLAQWLVDLAHEMNLCGVSLLDQEVDAADRHKPHTGHFPELMDQCMEIRMTATVDKANMLFERLVQENIQVFFTKTPVEFGMLGHE